MKVAIIVFSPSGHTLKVAKMIEKSMTSKDMQVQLVVHPLQDADLSNDKILEVD